MRAVDLKARFCRKWVAPAVEPSSYMLPASTNSPSVATWRRSPHSTARHSTAHVQLDRSQVLQRCVRGVSGHGHGSVVLRTRPRYHEVYSLPVASHATTRPAVAGTARSVRRAHLPVRLLGGDTQLVGQHGNAHLGRRQVPCRLQHRHPGCDTHGNTPHQALRVRHDPRSAAQTHITGNVSPHEWKWRVQRHGRCRPPDAA